MQYLHIRSGRQAVEKAAADIGRGLLGWTDGCCERAVSGRCREAAVKALAMAGVLLFLVLICLCLAVQMP